MYYYIQILFIFSLSLKLEASQYPVDVSFLVADLKYSKEQGVKICEVQHGTLSTFRGDRFLNDGNPVIANKFIDHMSQYYEKSWGLLYGISENDIRSRLQNHPSWEMKRQFKDLINDPEFQQQSKANVLDPFDLASYHGFVFFRKDTVKELEEFRRNYPGVVVVDAATHSYWIDKYKMSELFKRNSELATFKPRWNLYSKKDLPGLSHKIIQDLGGEVFVIKPRGAFLGNGVIIVSAEELDKTLRYIFGHSKELKKDTDRSYSHWYKDPFDTFLVEEFVESDPVVVDEKVYHPTMRAAFILTYNKGEIDVDILWCYWLLPYLQVGEKGSLNELYKAYCSVPFFTKVDQTTRQSVEDELQVALSLLYKEMLHL